jgi:hypothetical protein
MESYASFWVEYWEGGHREAVRGVSVYVRLVDSLRRMEAQSD